MFKEIKMKTLLVKMLAHWIMCQVAAIIMFGNAMFSYHEQHFFSSAIFLTVGLSCFFWSKEKEVEDEKSLKE